jgi:phage-related tail protein
MNRASLADLGKNMATQIAAGKVAGLLPAQRAAISNAIAAASELVATLDKDQVAALAAFRQATTLAQSARFELLRLIQEAKNAMKSVGAEVHEYDAVGFDPPVIGRTPVTPQKPLELSAKGFSNGVNNLRFTGNNLPGRVNYIVEARAAEATQYTIIGVTRRQRFKHTGVKPGVPIMYRVYAQSARGLVSQRSNEAAVYRE